MRQHHIDSFSYSSMIYHKINISNVFFLMTKENVSDCDSFNEIIVSNQVNDVDAKQIEQRNDEFNTYSTTTKTFSSNFSSLFDEIIINTTTNHRDDERRYFSSTQLSSSNSFFDDDDNNNSISSSQNHSNFHESTFID